jgi:hypothetical protein
MEGRTPAVGHGLASPERLARGSRCFLRSQAREGNCGFVQTRPKNLTDRVAKDFAFDEEQYEISMTLDIKQSLDSSNAITLMHKIWRACPCGFRAIRARRMDFVGRRTSYFPRIEVVSISQEMRGRSVHIENGLL